MQARKMEPGRQSLGIRGRRTVGWAGGGVPYRGEPGGRTWLSREGAQGGSRCLVDGTALGNVLIKIVHGNSLFYQLAPLGQNAVDVF